MDAMKITAAARALNETHGAGAEAYARHHLEAAEAAGLEGAARDWKAVLEALHDLLGKVG